MLVTSWHILVSTQVLEPVCVWGALEVKSTFNCSCIRTQEVNGAVLMLASGYHAKTTAIFPSGSKAQVLQ